MIANIGIDNCLNAFVRGVEYFDKDKLSYILNHDSKYQTILKEQCEDLNEQCDMLDLVRKYFMLSLDQGQDGYVTRTGHVNVDYNNKNNAGRLFAGSISPSLQYINHKIRHAIASDYYVDVDMVNAHPVILLYICKELKIKCVQLSFYVSERDNIFDLYDDSGFDRSTIKKLMIVIINGGKGIYKKVKAKKIAANDEDNWICKFAAEMLAIRKTLKTKYKERYERIRENERDERRAGHAAPFNPLLPKAKEFGRDRPDDDDSEDEDADEAECIKYNYKGKLISSLMCDAESIILKYMIEFFKSVGLINKMGRMDAVLCFDGVMLNRRYWVDEEEKDMLDDCESFITEKTGIEIFLKVKAMDKGVKMPTHVGKRPDPNNDIFIYGDVISKLTKWVDVCRMKNELVHFINKDTTYCRGAQPMIIKEIIKYDAEDEMSPDSIDRVYKLDAGFKLDISNTRFKATSIGVDEIKAHNLMASDLTISGYSSWIGSRYRNDIRTIIFDPKYFYDNKPTGNVYNLFNGLKIERDTLRNVEPLEETEPFFQHILKLWCKDSKPTYEYIINWFTSIVQFPWKKLRSCLVLKSTERAGKGIIIDVIRKILGENYVFHPSSPKDIMGDFNSGCRNKLLIFLDELVWGGDKEKAGTFKKLVSEKTISVNEKFKAVFTVKNLINTIAATNESWAVPAGTTDTRWMCVKLDAHLATCPREEKKRIVDKVLATDIRRLAKFFYTRDISGWNSDDIVITDELREQRIQSMSPLNKWWFDCLNNGYVGCENIKYYMGHAPEKGVYQGISVSRDDLYDSYKKYSNDRHMTKRSFNKTTLELLGNIPITRPRIQGKQVRSINIPLLDTLRKLWRHRYADSEWEFEEPELPEIHVPAGSAPRDGDSEAGRVGRNKALDDMLKLVTDEDDDAY